MKPEIHPDYHQPVSVDCACGNRFTTGSTASALKVEICSACHPFYTGKHKLVDTAGRVDKFRQRLAGMKPKTSSPLKKKAAATKKPVTRLS